MKNVIVRKSVGIVSKLLAVAAVAFVSTACAFIWHRPNTPAELLNKK